MNNWYSTNQTTYVLKHAYTMCKKRWKFFSSSSLLLELYISQGRKRERKVISISDNNYCFTCIHELTIETRSLNEEQVIKKKKELEFESFLSFVPYYRCSHANNLVSLFVRAQSWTKPFSRSPSLKNFYVISSSTSSYSCVYIQEQ